MVRSVGARRGLQDDDLDEVMQDVRIRLWQAQKSGKEIDGLGSSYMYQTATSAALTCCGGDARRAERWPRSSREGRSWKRGSQDPMTKRSRVS